jgi:hypothetical protein
MWHVVVAESAELKLEEVLEFYRPKLTSSKITILKSRLLDKVASLAQSAFHGQIEPTLENLELGHRRTIEGHVKIIYRIDGEVVTVIDFFDSRMNPKKVKR